MAMRERMIEQLVDYVRIALQDLENGKDPKMVGYKLSEAGRLAGQIAKMRSEEDERKRGTES